MLDRLVLELTTLFVSPHRIPKLSAIIKPATLFKFHRALVHRKYRLLFSSSHRKRKPGPKDPSTQLIAAAIVEMKRRNPKFGCVRIAQQINHAFGIKIDKDVVRRVLAIHFRPQPGADGPSWLTLIAHAKDSIWCVDLFRVESIFMRGHWVMLVMDVFTRRIVGSASAPHDRWHVGVPNVQCRHCWAIQYGSRSTLSFSPLARKPARARGRGNEIGSVRSAFTSVRRTSNRNYPAGIL
jgi:hypothetical protein